MGFFSEIDLEIQQGYTSRSTAIQKISEKNISAAETKKSEIYQNEDFEQLNFLSENYVASHSDETALSIDDIENAVFISEDVEDLLTIEDIENAVSLSDFEELEPLEQLETIEEVAEEVASRSDEQPNIEIIVPAETSEPVETNIEMTVKPYSREKKKELARKAQKYDNSKILEFLKLISANNGFENSCKQIYTMITYTDTETNKTNKVSKAIHFYNQSRDISDEINSLEFMKYKEYFVTKNSFYADKRGKANLFSFDNVVIDLDSHNNGLTAEQIDHEINKLVFILKEDYNGKFPRFNYTKSGRGMHIWVHLQSFSSKLEWCYKKIIKGLTEILQKAIDENEIALNIDTCVNADHSRFLRIPSTYNKSAHRQAEFIKQTDYRYSIEDLEEYIKIGFKSDYKPSEDKPKPKPKKKKRAVTATTSSDYTALHIKRINFLEKIIKDNNYDIAGRRNTILWNYYNECVQLYANEINGRQTAVEMVQALNKSLVKPIQDTELNAKINHIDRKDFLSVSTDKFLDFINATAEERKAYINYTNREIERTKQKAKKEDRNNEILKLYSDGMKQKEIAEKVGCDCKTVKSVLSNIIKSEKQSRDMQILKLSEQGVKQRDIAKQIGCSLATVNSVIKKLKNEELKSIAI